MLSKRLSLALASMLICSAAVASPAEFVAKGLGGLTLGQKWDDRVAQLGLKDAVCKPADVPDLADAFCFFRFAQPVAIGGVTVAQASAVLYQGQVAAVTVEALLEVKTAAAQVTSVVKAVESEWGARANTSANLAAFISTNASVAAKDPEAFLAAPAVLVKSDVKQGLLSITLSGMELGHLLAEADR